MPTMNLTEKRTKRNSSSTSRNYRTQWRGEPRTPKLRSQAAPDLSHWRRSVALPPVRVATLPAPAALVPATRPLLEAARGRTSRLRLGPPASAARRRCHSGRLRELHSWAALPAALGAVRLRCSPPPPPRHQAGFLRWGKRSSQSGLGWVVVGHVGVNGCLGLGGVRVSRSGARG